MAKRGFWILRSGYGWAVIAILVLFLPLTADVSAQTPTPVASGYRVDSRSSDYQGAFADLAQDIDAFWTATFAEHGAAYTSPDIVTVDRRLQTACGPVEPIPNALYCPGDHTIYLMPDFLTGLERDFGDYAPMTVLGHEWGHHVQALLGAQDMTSAEIELQADCLVGVFTRYARDTHLLDVGDFIEALNTSESAGDPISFPVDNPGAHGSPEDRVLALTEGFWLGPVDGCRTLLPAINTVDGDANDPEPVAYAPGLEQPVLLRVLPLQRPGCFRPQKGGAMSLDDVIARFTDEAEARDKLAAWHWTASAFREFTCETAGHDESRWFEIGVYRLGSAAAAHEAADYFASVRATAYGLQPDEPSGMGDHAVSLSGSAPDGEEFTLYISQGAWLARVTGVSDRGDPEPDVFTVARGLLAAQPAEVGPGQKLVPRAPAGNLSATFLPVMPEVPHATCFVQDDRGAYRFQNFADKMDEQGFSTEEISDMAWRDGAFVMFSCDAASATESEYIDIVIHSFATEDAADAAFSFVEAFYEPGDHEARACDLASLLVICADGRSRGGAPDDEVEAVLAQVVAGAR